MIKCDKHTVEFNGSKECIKNELILLLSSLKCCGTLTKEEMQLCLNESFDKILVSKSNYVDKPADYIRTKIRNLCAEIDKVLENSED